MVAFLDVILARSLSPSSLEVSCQTHLPMIGASSSGTLNVTKSVRQTPSLRLVESCSSWKIAKIMTGKKFHWGGTDRIPCGLCWGTSAPKRSTMNLRRVECRFFVGWISQEGRCQEFFSLISTWTLFELRFFMTTTRRSSNLECSRRQGSWFLCQVLSWFFLASLYCLQR